MCFLWLSLLLYVPITIASYLYSYVMHECLYDNTDTQVVKFVNQPGTHMHGYTPLMPTLAFCQQDKNPKKND